MELMFNRLFKTLLPEQIALFLDFKTYYEEYRKTLTPAQRDILDNKTHIGERVENFLTIPDVHDSQIFLIDKTTFNNLLKGIERVVSDPMPPGIVKDSNGVEFRTNTYPNAVEVLKNMGLSIMSLEPHGVPSLSMGCFEKSERENRLVGVVLRTHDKIYDRYSYLNNIILNFAKKQV